ncbi:MAG TPA: glycosyltransferase family 39 protein [Bryobacteraceae bacterium]|nr:glycosyltransferase family 39 protein [Bryobacteraceae bacterium]
MTRTRLTLLAILLAAASIRIHLLQIPLERDEGEYAYAGQLMRQGIPPYLLAANMKLPGTYAAYAVIMLAFGQSIAAIHLGLLLVNAAAIVLVYLLGRRLFSIPAGLAAGACYALLSLGSSVLGTQAHATHFIVLAALAATLLLLRYTESQRPPLLWLSALLFGLAFLMKQQAIVFVIFGAAVRAAQLWRSPSRRSAFRAVALYSVAAALPFALTCLILWRSGVFPRFWFWTFTYARQYALENSLSDGLAAFTDTFPPILQQNLAIWILAAAGLVLLWWKRDHRKAAPFTTAFLVFSFLAVCPGLFFREHYFVQLLPAAALLAGVAVSSAAAIFRSRVPYWLFAALLLFSAFQQREFLFRMSPTQACRELYGRNPFPEAIQVAAYIRAHSSAAVRIAVIGSEPEIYFYAARHSATSYIYTYGLMEPQPYALTMQTEMTGQIEAADPEYIVYVAGDESWLREPESPTRIFGWWSAYGPAHYRLVGVADIVSDDHTEYHWDAAAETYQPQSDHYLAVYRRKEPLSAVSAQTSTLPRGSFRFAATSQIARFLPLRPAAQAPRAP